MRFCFQIYLAAFSTVFLCLAPVGMSYADELQLDELGESNSEPMNNRGDQLRSALQSPKGISDEQMSHIQQQLNELREIRPEDYPPLTSSASTLEQPLEAQSGDCCLTDYLRHMIRAQATSANASGEYYIQNELAEGSSSSLHWWPVWEWKVEGFQGFKNADKGNPYRIIDLSDQRLAVVGRQKMDDSGYSEVARISVMEAQGSIIWERLQKPNNSTKSALEDAVYLPITNELLAAGYADNDIWLAKFDLTANVALWQRRYDLNKFLNYVDDSKPKVTFDMKFVGTELEASPDGAFILAGSMSRKDSDKRDLLLLRLDAMGNIDWARSCGGNGDDYPGNMFLDEAGDIYLGGGTTSKGSDTRGWLLKVNSSGSLVWETEMGRLPLRYVEKTFKQTVTAIDFLWGSQSVSLVTQGNQPFQCGRNWDGELAWTRGLDIERSCNSFGTEAALTCADLLFVPSIDKLLSDPKAAAFLTFKDERMPK